MMTEIMGPGPDRLAPIVQLPPLKGRASILPGKNLVLDAA
jgi:hypothetical protein